MFGLEFIIQPIHWKLGILYTEDYSNLALKDIGKCRLNLTKS